MKHDQPSPPIEAYAIDLAGPGEASDNLPAPSRRAVASGADTHRLIRLVRFVDIALRPQRRFLVEGLIPRSGLTVAWGLPKSFKSFWAFDLSMHVALGWEYRGKRVQRGPVAYCCFEGQGGVDQRVEAFRLRFLAEDITDDIPFFLQTRRLNLVSDGLNLIEAIRLDLAGVSPALVVLDTLNRSLRGSENSDQDMSDYINAADDIRAAFDCAVLIVHHCGLAGDRPRGHSSLTAAADAQLEVKRDGADSFRVRVEWMKDGEGEGKIIASRVEQVEVGIDLDGNPISSLVVLPSDDTSLSAPPLPNYASTMLTILAEVGSSGLAVGGVERSMSPCRHRR